jgi:hypothetical protein
LFCGGKYEKSFGVFFLWFIGGGDTGFEKINLNF